MTFSFVAKDVFSGLLRVSERDFEKSVFGVFDVCIGMVFLFVQMSLCPLIVAVEIECPFFSLLIYWG